MHFDTVYTKTAKGILEVKNRAVKLARDIGLVFLAVDGKATVADLESRSGIPPAKLHQTLEKLLAEGYIQMTGEPAVGAGPARAGGETDLDFTPPRAMAKLNLDVASRARAESDAIAHAGAERRAALDARLREEAEARARALAEVRVEAEAEAKAKAVAAAQAASEERAEAELALQTATDPAARAQAEARVRAATAAAARAEAEAKVRAEAQERASTLAAAKRSAQEKAHMEAESRLKAADEAQARAAAEAAARAALEAKIGAIGNPSSTQPATASLSPTPTPTLSPMPELSPTPTLAPSLPPMPTPLPELLPMPTPLPELLPTLEPTPSLPPTPQVVDLLELQQQAARLREAAEAERKEREGAEPKFELEPRAQELQERVQAERDARGQEQRAESKSAEPKLELEPRAQELQERVQASRRAREEAQTQNTAAAATKPATELGRQAPGKLPDLDIEAGVARTSPPPRPPPAFAPATSLARAMTEAETRAGASGESLAPEPTLDNEPPPDRAKEAARIEREAVAAAEAARARQRAEASTLSRTEQWRKEAEEDARREALFERTRRRRAVIRNAALVVVLVVAGLVTFLQFVSLSSFIPGAQQKLSARLNEPVAVASLRYPLLPTPRLIIEGVMIGKARPVKIDALTARILPWELLGDTLQFDTVEASGVTLDPDMLGAIPGWAVTPVTTGVQMKRLLLTGVQVQPLKRELGAFDADISFASNGTVRTATLKNEKVSVGLTPLEGQVRLSLSARGWRPPIGPAVEFTYLDFSGSANNARLVVNDLQARIAGGAVNATIVATWDGAFTAEGELKAENVRLQDVMPAFTSVFLTAGLLQVNGRYALRSDTLEGLFTAPRIDSGFSVTRGEFKEIDLVRTVQASSGTAFRGGRTPFDELSGTLQIAGGRYSYRQLQLTSGPLTASGAADVAPGGELSGRLNAEVGAKGRVVARATFGLAGTVQNPVLKQ